MRGNPLNHVALPDDIQPDRRRYLALAVSKLGGRVRPFSSSSTLVILDRAPGSVRIPYRAGAPDEKDQSANGILRSILWKREQGCDNVGQAEGTQVLSGWYLCTCLQKRRFLELDDPGCQMYHLRIIQAPPPRPRPTYAITAGSQASQPRPNRIRIRTRVPSPTPSSDSACSASSLVSSSSGSSTASWESSASAGELRTTLPSRLTRSQLSRKRAVDPAARSRLPPPSANSELRYPSPPAGSSPLSSAPPSPIRSPSPASPIILPTRSLKRARRIVQSPSCTPPPTPQERSPSPASTRPRTREPLFLSCSPSP